MAAHRSTSRYHLALLVLVAALLPVASHAHGDLHERMAQLTAQIAAQPDNAALHLQRADVRRQHGEFDAALADLADAARLKADNRLVLLAQARVFNDAGQTTNTLTAVGALLALEPDHPEALVIRARCRTKLGQIEGAIADFTLAITKSKSPQPDLFLERARAQAASGQLAKAALGLDEGTARLGAVPALQLAAIEYDRQRAAFADVLMRVDKLMAGQPVKEPWLVLRGEILAQCGRLEEARVAFRQTLKGIAQYPTARRELDLTTQLQARARAGLERVEARINQTNSRRPFVDPHS